MDDRPGDLKDLAARINEQHDNAERELRKALRHGRAFLEAARRTGELLNEAKVVAGHGNWMLWVRENVSFSHATANLYQALADGWDLLTDSDLDPNLGLHEAVRRIRLLKKGESLTGEDDHEGSGLDDPVVDEMPHASKGSARSPRRRIVRDLLPRLTDQYDRDVRRFEMTVDRAIEHADRLRPTGPIIRKRNARIRARFDILDAKLGAQAN